MKLKCKRARAVIATAALAATATACGTAPPSSGRGSAPVKVNVRVSSEVAALVPDQIRRRGTLRVAVPDIGGPLAFKENGEMRGMDPALGRAVAQVMGLRYRPQMVPFDSALPGLQSGRYDISYGEFYVTRERAQVVDFVTNWRDFSSFIVPSDAKSKPEKLSDACGRPIGAMNGSIELKFLKDAQATCAAAGKDSIDISAFPSISAGVLAMASHRVDGVLVGRGAGQSAIAQGQQFTLVGEIGGGPTATAVARTAYSEQMLGAVRKAYEVLIDNGAYAKILKGNNTSYGAISRPTVYTSGATLPVYK